MDSSSDKLDDKQGYPRLSAGCPYLGLKEDAETHFSTPSLGNYCHKVDPSEPVNTDHQENFCLAENYKSCLVFMNEWQGSLPDTIRGGGAPGIRSSKPVPVTAAVASTQIHDLEPEKVESKNITAETSETNSPLPTSQQRNLSDEGDPENLPWSRLHDEARSRYLDTKPGRKDRYIWAGLIIIASIILLASMWGMFNRFGQLQTQAELSMLSARTVAAITSDHRSALDRNATATAQALLLLPQAETPTPTLEATEEPVIDQELMTATTEAFETEQHLLRCSEVSGYEFEVISGPELSPRAGYLYTRGSPEPSIQASWIIKNPGECTWEQIVLKDAVTGEDVVPFLKVDGEDVDLSDLEQVIEPGEEVEVVVGFRVSDAETVNREWVLMINGFTLFDQHYIVLKVDNWIFIQAASTPTPTKVVKPPSKKTSTPKPPDRETESPPTRSP